ncbi:MAG: hypothetical protein A2V77_20645 [Anaeromyxobacter sp. RBG_16_69_14]|nr:MAG: hypothetical protein A2V77_20645 [Anaeromyxobacter sp. RBG_16_69_14]
MRAHSVRKTASSSAAKGVRLTKRVAIRASEATNTCRGISWGGTPKLSSAARANATRRRNSRGGERYQRVIDRIPGGVRRERYSVKASTV